MKETLETAAEALSEENFQDPDKVTATKKAIDEGIELLERRQKLIKLADWSEYGWWTVEEYEEDDLAKDSDDEKRIAKAEYRAEKKQKRAAAKTASSSRKNFRPFDHHRGNGVGNATTTTRTGYTAALAYGTGFGVQQGQPYRQFNPSPPRPCFACGKMDTCGRTVLDLVVEPPHFPEREAYVRKVEMKQLYMVYIAHHMH